MTSEQIEVRLGRRTSAIHRGRNGGQGGVTLMDMMIALAIVGIVMIPLLAWMILVLERSDDTRVQDESVDLASLSRTFIRDVEGALVATTGPGLGGLCQQATPLDPENPLAATAVALHLETDEYSGAANGTPREVVTDYAVKQQQQPDGSMVGELWRRRCVTVGEGETVTDFKLGSLLGPVDDLAALSERYAQFDCSAVNPDDLIAVADCEVVNLRFQPEDRAEVRLSATRRTDRQDVTDPSTRPTAAIECSPSCVGFRDADQSFRVAFNSSRSRNVTERLWDFGDGSSGSGAADPGHSFVCISGVTNGWDPVARECRFKVTLTVVGGDPLRAARATTTVVVKNSVPVIRLVEPSPPEWNGYRLNKKTFSLGTVDDSYDSDDADPTVRWEFGDGTVTQGKLSEVGRSVTHEWNRNQTTQVTVVLRDRDGATSSTITIPVVITNSPPRAQFTPSKINLTICGAGAGAGECDLDTLVEFDGSYYPTAEPPRGTYDPDGSPKNQTVRTGSSTDLTYEWSVLQTLPGSTTPIPIDLANDSEFEVVSGGIRQDKIAIRFPNTVAVYKIGLRAVDNEGLAAAADATLTANAPPRAIIDVSNPANVKRINYQTGQERFTFTGARSFDPDYDAAKAGGKPQIKDYAWSVSRLDSGPGACDPALQVGAEVTFIPSLCAGKYRVRLVVTDQLGANSPSGDRRVLAVNPAVTFVDVIVNPPPTITLSDPSPGDVQKNVDYTFAPTVTDPLIEPDDRVVTYEWSYRQSTTGPWTAVPGTSSPTLTRAFSPTTAPSVYQVKLRATDEDGAWTERSSTFTVVPATPVARFTVSRVGVTPAVQFGPRDTWFEFTNSSYDPDGSIVGCDWEIDKGGPTPETWSGCTLPQQSWSTSGTFTITLRVNDNDGKVAKPFTQTVTIFQPMTVTLTAQYGSGHNFADGGLQVKDPSQFTLTVSANDPNANGGIRKIVWDFGNGQPVLTRDYTQLQASRTDTPPLQTYQRQGTKTTFNGTVTVTSAVGLVETRTFSISVNKPPIAVLGPTPSQTTPLLVANCPRAAGVAETAMGSPYSVLGCRLVERIVSPYPYGLNTLNASGSFDPDGGPGFSSIPLKDLPAPSMFPTGKARICWYQGSTSFEKKCHAPNQALDAGDIILASDIAVPRTKSTQNMWIRAYDAFDMVSDQATPFGVYLNSEPYFVRIDSSLTSLPLGVPLNGSMLSSPALDADEETSLKYQWEFWDGGSKVAEQTLEDGRNYPTVTLPTDLAATSVLVRLTVTDDYGFAVGPVTKTFNVQRSEPVARITVLPGHNGTRVVPGERLVLDTPTGATSASLTATLSGATSTPGFGASSIQSYNWTIARLSSTGTLSPTQTTYTGATLSPITFANSGAPAGKVTGTWRVTLTVTQNGGGTGSTTFLVRINAPPVITTLCPSTQYSSIAPAVINFTAGANDDSDDPPMAKDRMRMRWDFGDGSVVTVPYVASLQHTYADFTTRPGIDVADRKLPTSFTIIDEDGREFTRSCTNTVRVDRAPEITASANRAVVTQKNFNSEKFLTFSADANDGDYADGKSPASAFTWALYEATTCTGTVVTSSSGSKSFSYTVPNNTPKSYSAKVTVNDPGLAGTTAPTKCVTVRVNAAPVAGIVRSIPNDPYYLDLAFQSWISRKISGANSTDGDGQIKYYSWYFYDECGNELRPPNSPQDSRVVNATDPVSTVKLTKQVPGGCSSNPGPSGKIKLVVEDNNGDVGEQILEGVNDGLSVTNSEPTARIADISPNQVTNPARITVDGSPSTDPGGGPITKYRWTITTRAGDPVGSPIVTTSAVTQLPVLPWGLYTVSLVVWDSDNLSSEFTYDGVAVGDPPIPKVPPKKDFRIMQRPTAVIRSVPGNTVFTGASSQRVSFYSDLSKDEDSTPPDTFSTLPGNKSPYLWEVRTAEGDLIDSSTGPDLIAFDFAGAGTSIVSLTVTDLDGNSHTATQEVVLNSKPAVTVVASPTVANAPANPSTRVSFSFDPAGTDDPDGSIVSRTWRFLLPNDTVDTGAPDNGTQSTPDNRVVAHSFPGAPGVYTAELVVTDNRGATTTKRVTVRVNARPQASLPASTLTIERGVPTDLDGSASSDADSQSPAWPKGINDYHWQVFQTGNPTALADFHSTTDVTPVTLPANLALPVAGKIKLTVTDVDGFASQTVERDFTLVNATPRAVIRYAPSGLVLSPNDTRTFRHLDSTDPDNSGIAAYRWEFFVKGQPTPYKTVTKTAIDDSVPETFTSYGTFVVKLSVEDNLGAIGTATVEVRVNRKPTADIAGSKPFAAQAGVPKTFDGAPPASSDPDAVDPQNQISNYFWTFRDLATGDVVGFAEGATPSFTFETPGNYTVSLVVYDQDDAASDESPAYLVVVS